MSRALTQYREFHGRNPRRRRLVDIAVPGPGQELVRLGKAVAIEYECSKLHGGGDGKRCTYRHVFETPCHLSMFKDGSTATLYITGNRLKVTDAGIEN